MHCQTTALAGMGLSSPFPWRWSPFSCRWLMRRMSAAGTEKSCAATFLRLRASWGMLLAACLEPPAMPAIRLGAISPSLSASSFWLWQPAPWPMLASRAASSTSSSSTRFESRSLRPSSAARAARTRARRDRSGPAPPTGRPQPPECQALPQPTSISPSPPADMAHHAGMDGQFDYS